ncbi:Zinc-finger homeodomain protein [Actinidia chinensis var. chinensis]|uniref:Zinc-finger homeodomain protein n=1 Tax=Actinidia chinensis var. chinensis TaxID=1590841 RepID=A0A2R6R5X8_ACTCC|nr:Zinc-finger homeodomain protein [Actinidia chinensis var. chinensis]
MEIRGQEKDLGMSIGYSTSNLSHQPNQDSSSKMFAASMAADRRRNETLDHHYRNQQMDLKQMQQQQTHIAARNQSPDLDPDPATIASIAIGTTSNSKTPQPEPPESTLAGVVRYKECLKNHAASIGGHVVDGCGEFMPGGEDGTPEVLRCAACDCHRNFHRREVEGEPHPVPSSHYHYNHSRNNSHRATTQLVPAPLPPPPPPHHPNPHRYSSHGPIPPVMMPFGGASGGPAESSSEDLNMFHVSIGAQVMGQPPFSPLRKRFRTKFTPGQKDKMQEFAERLEWKMQKQDEQQVEQFCAEVGVKRQVFKVWMHNNKQAMKKKQL